jgi:Flp pilus assembly protein TadG
MAVEFVVAAPAFVLLLLLISAGGQWVSATGQVGGAARDAVRAASVARSPADATAQAQFAASQDLAGLCRGTPSVTVTSLAGGRAVPFAAAQDVQVRVVCPVGLAAFRLIGFPASQSFSAVAVAPLDSFVCRSGTC